MSVLQGHDQMSEHYIESAHLNIEEIPVTMENFLGEILKSPSMCPHLKMWTEGADKLSSNHIFN